MAYIKRKCLPRSSLRDQHGWFSSSEGEPQLEPYVWVVASDVSQTRICITDNIHDLFDRYDDAGVVIDTIGLEASGANCRANGVLEALVVRTAVERLNDETDAHLNPKYCNAVAAK